MSEHVDDDGVRYDRLRNFPPAPACDSCGHAVRDIGRYRHAHCDAPPLPADVAEIIERARGLQPA